MRQRTSGPSVEVPYEYTLNDGGRKGIMAVGPVENKRELHVRMPSGFKADVQITPQSTANAPGTGV